MFVVGKVKKNVRNVMMKAKVNALIVMEMELKSARHAMVLENEHVEIATDLVRLMIMITISVNIDT
jgi:hypothetical protein